MPRKAKGCHTSPEKAGEHNFPEGYWEKRKNDIDDNDKLRTLWFQSMKNRLNYSGLWTEDALSDEINNYFQFCFEKSAKPSFVGLAVWLGTHKEVLYDWLRTDKGFKTNLIKCAKQIIEESYIERIEQYPTGNIFLLKSTHGHQDVSKVTIENTTEVGTDTINERLTELGITSK